MTPEELLLLNGAVYCKNVISKEMAQFLTHVLMRKNAIIGRDGDAQIPNALAIIDHDLFLETIQERIWPSMESITGKKLSPTYCYSRLYSNGDILQKHTDRPSCEYSVTVQLGRSHHYAWPIYAGSHRFDLTEGDGVIYFGCDVPHWRDECNGPKDYYSGQAFFHFVNAEGKYAEHAGDASTRTLPQNAYVQHRVAQMDTK
jgi:hypothetical protein